MIFVLSANTSGPFHIAVALHQVQLLHFSIVLATSVRRVLFFFLIILEHRSLLVVNQVIVLVFVFDDHFGPVVFI